jgi:hypothetical protein
LSYPTALNDSEHLDRFYENLTLSTSHNPIVDFLLVRQFYKQRNLKRIVGREPNVEYRSQMDGSIIKDTKPDTEEWMMMPHDVNAYYAPKKNMMIFPAGIFQAPYGFLTMHVRTWFIVQSTRFFDSDWPASFNFGSIASIIGRKCLDMIRRQKHMACTLYYRQMN